MPFRLQSNIAAMGLRKPHFENICMELEVFTVHIYCNVFQVSHCIKVVKTANIFLEISASTVFDLEE
jgi:hypothetical protein